jgi:ATP-binding cassette, subfamily C (CFTR/MRP), member 1
MLFSCFHPITGNRVSQIIHQESRRKKDSLLSQSDDKIEQFCDKYQNFIDVDQSYAKFHAIWENDKRKAGSNPKSSLLLNALFKAFWGDLMKAFFAKLVWSILVIFSIKFFVFRILDFIKKKKKKIDNREGIQYEMILCAAFFGSMFLLSIGIQQMGIYSSILGSKVKAALTTSIYKKMIVREAYRSKADVVSLVAKDVAKLAEACLSLQYLWSGIGETAAVFGVLIWLMKATILPGLGLMCVFLPLQYWLGLIVAYKKKNLSLVSNRRISLMEEIMRGIKLIKIYGWEESFFKNLNLVRAEEAQLLNRINQIKATILGLIFCLPPLMCMVIFGTQEATGKIESVLVFTTLSFFNTLRVPFSKLPKSLRDVLDAFSCLERIQNFLFEPELTSGGEEEIEGSGSKEQMNKGIVFQDVSASYGEGATIVLTKINLNIPPGSLMMVAGPVASGKSNLLKAILGDLTVRSGNCYVSASKAYVPQTPWTALGTVRDNILFGNAYNEALYNKVLHACALEPDLKLMADGDKTVSSSEQNISYFSKRSRFDSLCVSTTLFDGEVDW